LLNTEKERRKQKRNEDIRGKRSEEENKMEARRIRKKVNRPKTFNPAVLGQM
jgi:hypothetical protein